MPSSRHFRMAGHRAALSFAKLPVPPRTRRTATCARLQPSSRTSPSRSRPLRTATARSSPPLGGDSSSHRFSPRCRLRSSPILPTRSIPRRRTLSYLIDTSGSPRCQRAGKVVRDGACVRRDRQARTVRCAGQVAPGLHERATYLRHRSAVLCHLGYLVGEFGRLIVEVCEPTWRKGSLSFCGAKRSASVTRVAVGADISAINARLATTMGKSACPWLA
jgi:hypothetical protein